MGGGAIALGGVSKTFINGAIFTNNWSGFNGGAIATRRSEVGNLKNAGLSIANSTFINNKAEGYLYNDNLYGGNGGAIFNSFYKGAVLDSNDNVVLSDSNTSISSSTFSLNEAIGKGGAIYNSEAEVTSAKPSILILTDNNFNSNISAIAGGAIYNANDATIYFKGTNKFFGNKADGILNDIYNDGILNISGNLTLDGGINGNGSVIFEDNSLLTAELQKTTITASSITFDGNNSINLIAGNLVDGSYDFISTTTLNGITNVNLVDNPIYNLTMLDNGKVNISKKSNEEIKNNLNTNEQTANTIISLISIQGNGTENGNRISNLISNALQNGNTSVAVQATKDLGPTSSQQALGVSQSVYSAGIL